MAGHLHLRKHFAFQRFVFKKMLNLLIISGHTIHLFKFDIKKIYIILLLDRFLNGISMD